MRSTPASTAWPLDPDACRAQQPRRARAPLRRLPQPPPSRPRAAAVLGDGPASGRNDASSSAASRNRARQVVGERRALRRERRARPARASACSTAGRAGSPSTATISSSVRRPVEQRQQHGSEPLGGLPLRARRCAGRARARPCRPPSRPGTRARGRGAMGPVASAPPRPRGSLVSLPAELAAGQTRRRSVLLDDPPTRPGLPSSRTARSGSPSR